MCGYCCGSTPTEKRGDGHKGCSDECYNAPRPKPSRNTAARIAELEAQLAAARSALAACREVAGKRAGGDA